MKDIVKSILLSGEKYISSVLIAASYFVLAKNISPTNFGEYSAVESLAVICTFTSLMSIDSIAFDRALKSESESESVFISAIFLKMAFSFFGYILFLSLSVYIFDYSVYISAVIGSLIVFKSGVILQYKLISQNEILKNIKLSILVTLISLVIKFVFIKINNLWLYPFFFIVDSFFLFFIFSFNAKLISKMKLFRLKLAFEMLVDGKFFILSSFAILSFGKIDQIILSKLMDFEVVANYSLAMKVIGAFVLVSNAFNMVFARNVSLNNRVNKVKYVSHVREMLLFTLAVGGGLTIFSYFLSPIIIAYFYSDKYLMASELVRLASPLIFLIFISSSIGKILITEGLGKFAFFRNSIGLLWMVMMCFTLIPTYGVEGALYSAISSWFISSVVLVLLYKKTRFIYLSLL